MNFAFLQAEQIMKKIEKEEVSYSTTEWTKYTHTVMPINVGRVGLWWPWQKDVPSLYSQPSNRVTPCRCSAWPVVTHSAIHRTLYCAKGNYEFGITRIMKSLEPYSKKVYSTHVYITLFMYLQLGTDTWFYAKRCLCSLVENMVS